MNHRSRWCLWLLSRQEDSRQMPNTFSHLDHAWVWHLTLLDSLAPHQTLTLLHSHTHSSTILRLSIPHTLELAQWLRYSEVPRYTYWSLQYVLLRVYWLSGPQIPRYLPQNGIPDSLVMVMINIISNVNRFTQVEGLWIPESKMLISISIIMNKIKNKVLVYDSRTRIIHRNSFQPFSIENVFSY